VVTHRRQHQAQAQVEVYPRPQIRAQPQGNQSRTQVADASKRWVTPESSSGGVLAAVTVGVGETEREEGEENRRVVAVVRRPTYLLFWATVLSIVSVGSVGAASVLRTGGVLCPRGARASSHRRWLRSAMIGFAVVSSGGGVGVSAVECTASTCCEVAIPKLPSTTTKIDKNVCNQGT